MIRTTCPNCGRTDAVADYLAKLPVLCKGCGHLVTMGEPLTPLPPQGEGPGVKGSFQRTLPKPPVAPPPPPPEDDDEDALAFAPPDPSHDDAVDFDAPPLPAPKPVPPVATRASKLAVVVSEVARQAPAFPKPQARKPGEPPRVGTPVHDLTSPPLAKRPEPKLTTMPLASRWRRLGARAIFFAGYTAAILFGGALLILSPESVRRDELVRAGVGVAPFILYLLANGVMIGRTGQDIGKRLLGIRIVCEDGVTLGGFYTSFLKREALWYLITLFGRMLAWVLIEMVPSMLTEFVGFALISFGPLFFLVDNTLIFTADERCLHDRIAGTRVVRVEPDS